MCIVFALIGLADKLQFNYNATIFSNWKRGQQWINPRNGWRNKYKKSWFLTLLFSTILVFTTDLWHLVKFLYIGIILFIVVYLMHFENIFFAWICLYAFYGVIFEIVYHVKFKK
jgi:hypothetical protein